MNQPQDDTPLTNALTARMATELDRPMLQQNHFIELCDHARDLERSLHEARGKLDQAQRVIVEANNSLFGSQGFFLSVNGGPPNDDHLSRPIEGLKGLVHVMREAKEKAEQQLAEAQEALRGTEEMAEEISVRNVELATENEALAADARRYKWIREYRSEFPGMYFPFDVKVNFNYARGEYLYEDALDAAIDAALEQKS